MPLVLLQDLGGFFSQLTPFREKLTPLAPSRRASPPTHVNSSPVRQAPEKKYLTPVTPTVYKHKRSSPSSAISLPSPKVVLLTPSSYSSNKYSQARVHKRPRAYPSPIASVEHECVDLTPMARSGATKPANYQPQTISPSAWKHQRDERLAEIQELQQQGWRHSDVALFHKICLRGFEPLLPLHWGFDFPILPDSLFSQDHQDAFICAMEHNPRQSCDFRASKILWSLIELGPRVRDDLMLGVGPQRKIGRTFASCLRWAMDDANITEERCRIPPLAVVCTAPEHVSADEIQRRLDERLSKLSDSWHKVLGPDSGDHQPPLYGIVVSHAVWAILSYTPSATSKGAKVRKDPDPRSKMMNSFSFTKAGQEVWVALAFALFAVHCRDELLKVQKDGLVADHSGLKAATSLDTDE